VVDGKWIDGLVPDMRAEQAAAAVLSARLSAVAHHLPLAVEKATEDVEHVHQLRVATRRAGAALAIFRDILPKKGHRRAKVVLRSLRRAAGEARDWDVFLETIAESKALQEAKARAAADFLTGYGLGHRAPAQANLVAVASERAGELADVLRELPEAVHAPDPPLALAALASEVMPRLFGEFAARAEAAPSEPADLHQLRIVGKRLRYAMELFATCYAPSFRETLYPAVEAAQTILGCVQDGHVARDRLAALEARLRQGRPATAKRVKPGFQGLLAELRARTTAEKRAFRRWVRDWRKLTQAHPLTKLLTPVSSSR
jgi:CHAD domain-containing protein